MWHPRPVWRFVTGTGASVNGSPRVYLQGHATDPEDGELVGGSLVWTSNLSDLAVTGTNPTPTLPPGTHVITLAATDSDGNVATDSITINVH